MSKEQSKHDHGAQTSQVYRRLLRYLKPHRSRFAMAVFAMVIFGATDGVLPFLLKRVLDDIFGSQNEGMLWMLVVAIIIFAIVRATFSYLHRYLGVTVGLRIIRDLRNEINAKLLNLGADFYSHFPTGSLIARVTNDTLLVRQAITDASVALVRDSIRIVALLIAALYLDPLLASIAFIVVPLGIIPVIRFGRKVRRLSRTGQDQLGGLTSILQEGIVGHKVIQSFTMEEHEQERFIEENQRSTNSFEKAEKYGALSGPTNEVLASIAVALVIVYGGLSVISGVRTQGDFIAFITTMFLLYEPLKKLGRINATIQTGVAAANRVFEVLDAKPSIVDDPQAEPLARDNLRIEYNNVFFRYPESVEGSEEQSEARKKEASRQWALEDVSLTLEPGETVALVGMSGGGKSTLVNLLPRFYDPQHGSITIGGTDIRKLTVHSLRSAVAVVGQQTFLFNESVMHNIGYGRSDLSEDDIISAAKAANAHNFIMNLPQGYDTVIGEQGLRLSGGERARIALARALLKDAPVLILDEATANLDSESERFVQDAIDLLMEGRTVFVIAHRLSTVRKANKIAVVVDGRIVEVGSHDELLKKDGEYAKLYRLQFADSEDTSGRIAV